MARIGGWNIWAKSGDRLRQFTVAEPSEDAALETFKQTYPGLDVVSRQAMDLSLMNWFGAKGGSVTEWVPIDPQQRITRAGGTRIQSD